MPKPSRQQPPAARRSRNNRSKPPLTAARRSRASWWLAFPVVLAVAIVGAALYALQAQSAREETPLTGLAEYENLSRNHSTTPIDYPQTPPVGGDHAPVWAGCDGAVYEEDLEAGQAVHSLEHGTVWISVRPDLAANQRQSLADRVSGAPYTMLSPVTGQDAPIVLTAWGVQLAVETADDPRIDAFLSTYRQGPQTPEMGATCQDPTQGM